MTKTATRPTVGDRFQVLCSDTRGVTILAEVTAERVTQLDNGWYGERYRVETTRPGATAGADCPRLEFTVRRDGTDIHGYVTPLRD